MHGEIKLGQWRPFRAEQVISRDGQFVWAATVSVYGIPIRGSDRLLQGHGAMNWKLLDLIPVMRDSGPHITRSAIGRVEGELAAWLPSIPLGKGVSWNDAGAANTRVRAEIFNEPAEIELEIGSSGRLKTLKMSYWGNPNGGDHR
jgi:hypothetical protein